jgi:hypothetical protein
MVGRLELGARDVAAGPVKPLGIPPGDPARGGELDLVDRAPGTLRADELGLVEAVDGLGEGVVVRVALAPDRGDRALVGEALGVPDGEVLGDRRLQIAISSASRASSARSELDTRQPTMARLKASITNAV